ncbi:MAG: thioredoxin fold domain-containing protein [Flavobacteriaceae bacterium]|nr:thioredoxin fold domain-containing protein [Flavobacteriaceae bacterium]
MRKIVLAVVFALTTFIVEAQTIYSFDDAQKIALGTNKLIILDFTASWCGPCRKMEADVWSKEDIKLLTSNFVFAKIDLDTNKGLASKYNVRAIPNILITDGNGKILEQNVGYMDIGQVKNLLTPYQLNIEYMTTESVLYFKSKVYSTALRLAVKYFDFSLFLDDSNVKKKFVTIATEYLDDALSLLDKKDKKYDEIKQMIEIVELSEHAYLFNFDKLEKKIAKVDVSGITSSYGKKQMQFYQYLIALNKNGQEEFLTTTTLEGFDNLKAKAELIFEKSKS